MLHPKKPEISTQEPEEEDTISSAIGLFGKWQLQMTFLLSLFNIPCTWHIFCTTFYAEVKDFWCSRPENLALLSPEEWVNNSQPSGHCSILNLNWKNITIADIQTGQPPDSNATVKKCDSWEWAGKGSTVISEWNLVCEREDLNNMAEMMFLAGVALGGLVSGFISDRYGRKRTLMISVLLQTLLGTLIAFNPWFELYMVLRAMLGFISVSVVFSGFVLSIELVGGYWRAVAGVSYLFPVSLSYMSISGIAFLLRDWRHLQLAISLPGILLLSLWWVLPESPRWLLAMGKKNEVLSILHSAASVNNRQLPPAIDKILLPSPTPEESAGILDLFRTRRIRMNTIFLFVIWFTVYLVYYGLVLNIGNIGGDIYVTSILSGVVEIPALVLSILILLKMGRRWPMCCTLVLSGLACLCTLLVPRPKELQWLTTSLALIAKFSVSSSNAVIPVFTAELYPTVIRNLGVGASNVSAGIALMLVPYFWKLTEFGNSVPMGTLGVWSILGGLCVLFLPETGNRPLEQKLERKSNSAVVTNQQNENRVSTVNNIDEANRTV